MTKQRKIVVVVLLLVALVVSGVTFAYWAGAFATNQAPDQNPTIKIGEGETVTTTVTVSGGTSNTLDLVPVGREQENSVSSITYTFNVAWNISDDETSAAGAKADLTVTPTLSGFNQAELDLFTVTEASTQNIIYGSTTAISITVEFTTEPANKAQYDLVVNKLLTLNVSFTLGTVTPA